MRPKLVAGLLDRYPEALQIQTQSEIPDNPAPRHRTRSVSCRTARPLRCEQPHSSGNRQEHMLQGRLQIHPALVHQSSPSFLRCCDKPGCADSTEYAQSDAIPYKAETSTAPPVVLRCRECLRRGSSTSYSQYWRVLRMLLAASSISSRTVSERSGSPREGTP